MSNEAPQYYEMTSPDQANIAGVTIHDRDRSIDTAVRTSDLAPLGVLVIPPWVIETAVAVGLALMALLK